MILGGHGVQMEGFYNLTWMFPLLNHLWLPRQNITFI